MEIVSQVERMIELNALDILNTNSEAEYDHITWLASEICDVPISLISFVGEETQFFKSNHGLEIRETPVQHSFCAHALNNPYELFIVEDATQDERFKNNPLVTGHPHIVFYAGVVLVSKLGNALGALCVIDNVPRNLTEKQKASLKALAKQVELLIELKQIQFIIEQNETQHKNGTNGLHESFDRVTPNADRTLIEIANAELQNKVKEQTCLYHIARLINHEIQTKELLEKVVEILPQGLAEELNSIAQINFDGKSYYSKRHARSNPSSQVKRKTKSGKIFEILVYTISPRIGAHQKEQNEVANFFIETIADTVLLGIEQIEAKQNLKQSEQRLSTILNTEPDCVKVVSKDGKLLSMNQAGLRMIEADNSQLLFGQPVFNLVHPKDVGIYKNLHQHVLNGDKGEARFRIISLKGNLLWMESHAVPMRDENGKVTSVLSVTSDITQKIKTEDELQKTKKIQDVLINVTLDLIWSIDTKFRIIAANKAFKDSIKLTNGVHINEGDSIFSNQLNESDIRIWKDYYKRALAGETFSVKETFNNPSRKTNTTCIFSFYPIKNDLGIINGAACYGRDITELVIQQNNIEEAKAELEKIMSSSMDMICTFDAKGSFKKVSAASLSILGYKPEELEGTFYKDIIDPDYLVYTDKKVAEIVAGKNTANVENHYIKKNGNPVTLLWSMNWDENEQLIYCVARDATQIEEAEAQVKTSESLMKEAQKLAKMGSWDFVIKTDTLTWSDALYDVFEADRETFKETHGSFLSLVDKEDIQMVKKTSELSQQNGEPFNISYHITTPKGEHRIIEEFGYSEKDKNGKIIRLFGTAQDVTKRKKAEENIQLMLNNTEESFILVDTDLKIMSFNKQFELNYEKLFKKKVTIGDSILNLTQADRSKELKKRYNRVFKGQREESIIKIDFENEPRIFRNIFNPAKDKTGKIIGAFVTSKDITEKEIAAEAVLKSNERYQYVTKATSDAIWDYDVTKQEVFWGEGFNSLFGYNTSDLKKNYEIWEQCLHPEDKEIVNQLVHSKLSSSDNMWQQEYRFRKADGTYANILDKVYVIRDEKGSPTRIIGAMQDLTQAKIEQQMLKLKESVIANTTDAVIITDAEPFDESGLKIVYVNEAFTKLTGYSADELIGKNLEFYKVPNQIKKT